MVLKFFRLISSIALPRIVVVGVDIQDTHVFCVAALRKGEEDVDIVASGGYEIPSDVIEGGELRRPDILREVIEKFIALIPQHRWKGNSEPVFVLSLPPRHLYTETVFFPAMKESEVNDAVRLKMETSLPWPLESAYLDWRFVDVKDPDKTAIFTSAISKSILDKYLKVFFEKNLRVGACEYHLLSLIRFVKQEDINTFIFVLIDEDGLEFCVYSFGSILTHYLEDLSRVESRQKVLEDKIRQLTSYAETNYGVKVDRIFIFDISSWGKTPDELQAITGIPTQPFMPSPHLDARLSIAYGASLRPYSSSQVLMNLLPVELGGGYQENLFFRTLRFWFLTATMISFIFIAAFVGIFVFLASRDSDLTRQNSQLAGAFANTKAQSAPLLEKVDSFNSLTEMIVGSEGERSLYSAKVISIINEAALHNVSIINLKSLSTASFSVSFTAKTRSDAVAFKDALVEKKLFSSVTIPVQQLQGETNIRVDATLNY